MGCDIHFYVEVKSRSVNRHKKLNDILDENETIEDSWESADEWIEDTDPDAHSPKMINRQTRFYSGRNYFLFGVLAGVRYDCPNPIAADRGIPADLSPELLAEKKAWDGDGHSHSWASLTELINADWNYYNNLTDDGLQYLMQFTRTIEKMKTLSNNTDDVRCVFWFDN